MSQKRTPVNQTPEEKTRAKRLALLKRAHDGDEAVRANVQKFVADFGSDGMHPVKHMVRDAIVKRMCGNSILLEEDIIHQMRKLQKNLDGDAPTPLERLLVERIMVCWLHLHYYETIYAQNLGDLSLRQGEFHGRRIDQAHRRYLSAIKTLAQVRRFQLPAVQVNIGQNQNIGQTQNIADKQVNIA